MADSPDPAVTIDAPVEQAPGRLSELSGSERDAWRMTGDMPPRQAPGAAGGAEPDEDEAQPAGAPSIKPISRRQQQINDLIRARAEAEQRAVQLEARLHRLERGEAPAAPQPATFVFSTPRPQQSAYETWDEYDEAVVDWKIEKREAETAWKAEQAARETYQQRQTQSQDARFRGWADRRDTFAEAYPERFAKLAPFLGSLHMGTPLSETLLDSPHGLELVEYLLADRQEFERIGRLGPVAQLRELAKVEARIEARTSASAGPAAQKVTNAPAPPPTLGQRPTEPADEEQAAVAGGDFRRYMAAANNRELSRR